MAQTLPSQEWIAQLDELLSAIQEERTAASEEQLVAHLATLDPDLLAFLVGQISEQPSPEAAGFLELVAAQATLPEETRAQARAGLALLVEQGITPAAPGAERFVAGYVQRSRESGDQIMLLGWRLPNGTIEAMVYLLDWRGDGLKDFYITRHLSDEEWRQLVEHNAAKGPTLAEIDLSVARALLEASIAEGRRFSRPLPREYKLTHAVNERRILQADLPPAPLPSFVGKGLPPEDVVAAYIGALHYRDFTLNVELLASDHPARIGRTHDEAVAALRAEQKQGVRREESAEISRDDQGENGETAVVLAAGQEVAVEKTGKRVRQPVRERYTLVRDGEEWRIRSAERQ